MGSEKKIQKAGSGSKQIQAERDVHIHEGPSYAEIIQIVEVTTARIVKEYIPEAHLEASAKALEKAQELTSELSERFINKPDDLIAAFRDPSFNYDWSDATRAAIESKDRDIERIIVDLIEDRVSGKDSPRAKIVTSVALRAAGQMGVDSRNGLALIWWGALTYPLTNGLPFDWYKRNYVGRLENAQVKFPLPSGSEWLEDLDILDMLRLQDASYATIGEYYGLVQQNFKPYLAPGISRDDAERLMKPIQETDPSANQLLIPHPLKDDFLTIRYETLEKLRAAVSQDVQAVAQFEDLVGMHQFDEIDASADARLKELLSRDASYCAMEEWWNGLRPFTVTAPGRVVAYSLTKQYSGPIQGITSAMDVIAIK